MDQLFFIGKRNRPVRFGYGAIYQFEKKTGESVLKLLEDISAGNIRLSAVIDLTYAGLLNGAKANGLRPDFTADDVAQWFDDTEPAFIEQLLTHLANSFPQTTNTDAATGGAPVGE